MRYRGHTISGDDRRGWRVYQSGEFLVLRRTLDLAKQYVDRRDDRGEKAERRG